MSYNVNKTQRDCCFHFRIDVGDIPEVSGIENMSKEDIVQLMLEDHQEKEEQDDNCEEREEQDADQEREEQDEEQDEEVTCQSVVKKFFDYDDNLAEEIGTFI